MATTKPSDSAGSAGDAPGKSRFNSDNLLKEDNSSTAGVTSPLTSSPVPSNVVNTLSPEELEFVTMAKKSGQLAELVSLAKLSDDSTTLEEIRASTLDQIQLVESITKQTSVLQLNMERCKSLIDSNAQLQKLRAGAQQAKLAKGQAAKAQLEEMAASDESELQRAVQENLAHLEKIASDPNYLNGRQFALGKKRTDLEVFVANHQFYGNLLEKLQALGWEIKVSNDNKQILATARYYCSLEVMFSILACKRTLNQILVEAHEKYALVSPAATGRARALEAEIEAVKDEINSLWDEVVPVAHMATEKSMLEPILKVVNVKLKSERYQNAIIGSYIGSCLSFLNERFELLAKRVNIAVYHHLALSIMYEYHRSFDAKEAAQISYMTTKGHGVDPANAWRGPKHATTLLHYIQQGMKSYGGFPTKALDPLTPAEKKVTMLNEFVALRAGKDKERLKNLHALFESAVNDDLHKGYSVNVDVLTCILADSLKGYDYCGAALRDAQTEESLQALEEEVMSIQQLQKALGIAEVPVTKILRPLYQHLAGQAFAEKLGLINVTGLVPRGDRSAIVLPSSKLLEVVQRWSDLIDTSKK